MHFYPLSRFKVVLGVLWGACHGAGTTWGYLNVRLCNQLQALETRGAFSVCFDESLRKLKMLKMSQSFPSKF